MTMIQIIMCVGICIDFSTHICHAFIQADGARNERVTQALDTAGGPIFNGAISTIIGVLVQYVGTKIYTKTNTHNYLNHGHGVQCHTPEV
jgi:predicted RND superfamily exporter protein